MTKLNLFLVLTVIGCLGSVSSDLYTPSIPFISKALGADIDHVQWSVAIFMFGLSFSQLVYGPLSEGLGRKRCLSIGILIAIFGTGFCTFTNNVEFLLLGRLIQGVGFGATSALWRSIFRDQFQGDDLIKYSSYLTIAIVLIVPSAPALGGYLQEYFGWRSCFIFILFYCLVALWIVFSYFKETNLRAHRSKLNWTFVNRSFKEVLSHPVFLGYTVCTFFSYGAFFSWFTTGPVLLIDTVGLTPIEFGWFTFVAGGVAMSLAAYLNGKLLESFSSAFVLRLGWIIMILSGVSMLILYFMEGTSFMAIGLPFFFFYFGATFIWPGCFGGAFKPFGKTAGYAGSAYGFLQMAGAAVLGSLVSYLPDESQVPISIVFIVSPWLSWIVFESVVRSHERKGF